MECVQILKRIHDVHLPVESELNIDFLKFVDEYCCNQLIEVVSKYLPCNLTKDVFEVANLASRMNLNELLLSASRFIMKGILDGTMNANELKTENIDLFNLIVKTAMNLK